ncbi:hypothetical protein [Fundidesulfovibrio soli]|uniref:hypothetical protein n=1 Tax=Fundidesulfovibrio soli TaxID=2922716 RepID=UPI001FAFAF96|nr:hypothetical protein [Fundidesulfovibrio soli]
MEFQKIFCESCGTLNQVSSDNFIKSECSIGFEQVHSMASYSKRVFEKRLALARAETLSCLEHVVSLFGPVSIMEISKTSSPRITESPPEPAVEKHSLWRGWTYSGQCTECGNSFETTFNLFIYQSSHAIDRSIECSGCDVPTEIVEWANFEYNL